MNKEDLHIRIRVFRAVDDLKSSLKYINGHRRVLEDHGFSHLTTNNEIWFTNPNVICLLAEINDEGQEAVGGIRLEMLNKNYALPLEEALHKKDSKVVELIRSYPENKTTEMCGLWNSKRVAGKKLSLFLGRSAMAIAPLIGLENMFIFIAKYTMEYAKRLGFRVVSSIGNQGDFLYPTDLFIANVLFTADLQTLSDANEHDKNRIQTLRKSLDLLCDETEEDVNIRIEYQLGAVMNMLI